MLFAALHEFACDVVDGARSRQRVPIGKCASDASAMKWTVTRPIRGADG